MAVSVEAAFVLLDKASGPLKDIQRQAILTDKALNSMGGGTSGTSKLESFTSDLEAARGGMKNVTGEAVSATREVKKLGTEVDRTGNFFSRRLRDLKNWTGGTSTLASVTRGAAGAVGGLWGGLTGAVTAFPPLITAVTLAAPAIVSLSGAVGALASSLTFAVGGGTILGGGLLGSFAAGFGSLIAVGKPALASLKSYQTAVQQLNTAEESGSATAVKAAQKRLDAIDKANPGVKKLSGNLTGLQDAWKKATAPGRQELFSTANDAIKDLRKQIGWLGPEADKNVKAITDAFKKYFLPLLDSKVFKTFVETLGDIFRKNLPGFAKGVVGLFKGVANILQDVAGPLEKTGGGFAKFGKAFDDWTKSTKGKKQIDDMIDAFKQWMRLIKGILRIFVDVVGAGQKTGTNTIKGWADSINDFADKLSKPGGTKGIQNFFEQAMKKTEDLWPILKNVATSLADIYKVFKPLSDAVGWILQNFPPPLVAALAVAILGRNIIAGAFKTGKGAVSAISRFASKRGGRGSGVAGTFSSLLSEQGQTPLKPMYVFVTNEGFGGLGKRGEVLTEGGVESETKAIEKRGFFRRAGDRTTAARDKVVDKLPDPLKKGVKKINDANDAVANKVVSTVKKAGNAVADTRVGTKVVAGGNLATDALKGLPAAGKIAKALKLPVSVVAKVATKVPILDFVAFVAGATLLNNGSSVEDRVKSGLAMVDPTTLLGLLPGPTHDFPGVANWLLRPAGKPFNYAKLKKAYAGPGGSDLTSVYAPSYQPGIAGPSFVPGGTGTPVASPSTVQASDDKLKKYAKKIDDVRTNLAKLDPKQLQSLLDWTGKLADDPNLQKYKGYLDDVRDALKDPTKGLKGALDKVAPQFDQTAQTAGTDLANIQSNTQTTVQNIKDLLGTKSKAATDALATNYAVAAAAVKTSMQDGVIKNTQDGINTVQGLMTKAFQQMGISPSQAKKLASHEPGLKSVPGAQGNARGGRLPGEPQGDHLPLYGRGGSLLGVADGGELVVNRHTEGRVNSKLAAFGTTLGKEVAGETRPHFATGGRVPRFATGGVVGEVNQYFSQRGWDKAAIAGLLGNAMQESSLNPNTPGGGLWQQISNFGSSSGGSLQNQMNRMYPQIVGLRGAMNRSTPAGAATIFEQQFERAGIPALANRIRYAQAAYAGKLGAALTGGSITPIALKAPTVGGFGFQQAFGQANVNAYTNAANFAIRRAAMAVGGAAGGGFGGVVPGGAGTVRDPSGKPVAAWIEPILNWARQRGWHGTVESGYRSYAEQAAIYASGVRPAALPGTSNHEQTKFPGGAVDVTDASTLSSVLMRGPYGSTLIWAGAKDPVHFSHPHDGHYALGGRVPWFQSGADFIASRPQLIGVGDGPGSERVTVTPQNQNPTTNRPVTINIGRIDVHRKGDVKKIVDEEMKLLADSIGRQL